MKTTEVKPTDLKNWSEINQSKAKTDSCAGHPEWYDWYPHTPTGFKVDTVYLPHRKPTLDEQDINQFT